jgi:Domain of unknown function (DUF4397)
MNRATHPRRRWCRLGAGLATGIAAAVMAVPAQAATAAGGSTATVNVVHGIPGITVKVCLDGKPAIRQFRYGEKVVGLALPAGTHQVRVVPTAKACSSPAILKKHYVLEGGGHYTVVAALRPSGEPVLSTFTNRVRPTRAETARLTVRHTADAPAVNVLAGSIRLIGGAGFTWGDTRTLAVPDGKYRVKVALPGSRKAVIGPRHLALRSGNAYEVYAVGSPDHYRLVVVRTAIGTH